MADERDTPKEPSPDPQSDYIRGGKGRKDDVGKSGIYPASAPNVPPDAEIRTEGGLAHHGEPPTRKAEDEA